ncbi:MAG TPA: serine hydrolase domain-containing protein [Burkholderiaceae bacterium]|nr:serine hydrolase domain-containing protein [Burkholderiaceae bacterium]
MNAPSLRAAVDATLGAAVDAGRVPGVIATVADAAGPLYAGAFGVRALGAPEPMTLDTVCWIASMTKPLTAAAAMQLVERGVLALDAPAQRWAPPLASIEVLDGFDDAGEPRTRPPKRPITLRDLLTHTAGFGYAIWDEATAQYQRKRELPGVGSGRLIALQTVLRFDPGERWMYGINIDWVGRIVELATGLRLGDYLKQNLLGPLGMNDTAFRLTPELRGRLAKVHQRDAAGALQATDWQVVQDTEFDLGGGGLYSTAGDYLRFVRMMLNRGELDGERVLAPETADALTRSHTGAIRVTRLPSTMPEVSNPLEIFPDVPKGWGLSAMVNLEPVPTGRAAGGLMWGGLPNTYFWIDPARGIGGVYLTQLMPFLDVESLPLYCAFEKAVYDSLGR